MFLVGVRWPTAPHQANDSKTLLNAAVFGVRFTFDPDYAHNIYMRVIWNEEGRASTTRSHSEAWSLCSSSRKGNTNGFIRSLTNPCLCLQHNASRIARGRFISAQEAG